MAAITSQPQVEVVYVDLWELGCVGGEVREDAHPRGEALVPEQQLDLNL